jgi:hypothetical protein
MADTFLALLLGHVMGDYLFQTLWMVQNKRRVPVLLLHVGIMTVSTIVVLGGGVAVVLGIAAVHLAMDATKTYLMPGKLWAYFFDQFVHVLTILIAAAYFPTLFADGLWGGAADLFRDYYIVATGLIVCTLAGGPTVGMLLSEYIHDDIEPGLTQGGRLIGLLERSLIFLMVLPEQVAGIGFLIAAKSILRFDTASKDQKNSEYVIIGTLASFAWALLSAYLTKAALS